MGHVLYIGRLSRSARGRHLEEAFGKYGDVRGVSINPRGFGFVEFRKEDDAREAKRALDGKDICGSRITVEVAHNTKIIPTYSSSSSSSSSSSRRRRSSSRSRSRSPSSSSSSRRRRSRSPSSSSRRRRSRSPRRSRSRSRSPSSSRSRSRSRSPRRTNNDDGDATNDDDKYPPLSPVIDDGLPLDLMKRVHESRSLYEGFWGSAWGQPQKGDQPWEGQQDFLDKLTQLEKIVPTIQYRGFSWCRFVHDGCSCKKNGSREFQDKTGFNNKVPGWTVVWPEGFRHYIEAHNLRPTQEFIDYVLEAAAPVKVEDAINN
eukprot:TRINITY_DN3709_c1_g1_i2.p1 TRINITY_DN3709_c1_g1~~TRINITY_DN3709_c1_g1_i2.p1  ORF type:complete len:316 (+),score=60.10 TRINITY_DN3709_c1_g1_i2:106-1053(+)